MTISQSQIDVLLQGGNTLTGLAQAVADISKDPTGADQAAALLGLSGVVSGLVGNYNTPFLQALGAGISINTSLLGVAVNAVQLASAYSAYGQAMQSADAAGRDAASKELADKAIGLFAAIGGTLAAIPVPGVQQLGLAIWLGGTAAQQVMNGNAYRALEIVGSSIASSIADIIDGPHATVRQYDVGQGEVVTVEFSDEHGIVYGEYGKVTGSAAAEAPPDVTIIHKHGVDGWEIHWHEKSSVEVPISLNDFDAGLAYAETSQDTAFDGNTADYANALLGAAGLDDSLPNYLEPSSISDRYMELLDWFDHEPTWFSDNYMDPDTTADQMLAEFLSLQDNLGDGESGRVTDIMNRVGWGIASPIVLDLGGDGIQTISITDSSVVFDINGDGVSERVGWLSGNDAFVVLDRNGNGVIDDVSEMFGGTIRGEGFAKLDALDDNNNGLIESSDNMFAELRLWKDSNENGRTDSGELHSLEDSGVSELKTDYVSADVLNNWNLIGEFSHAVVNGDIMDLADVYFRYSDLPGAAVSQELIVEGVDASKTFAVQNSSAMNAFGDTGNIKNIGLEQEAQGLISALAQFDPLASAARNSISSHHWMVDVNLAVS